MPFDALTMAAVADELREKALGGRIQGVFLPAPLSIGLEIYAHHDTHYIFASAHPQHARVHLTQSKLSRGTEDVTPLLLLLRKYVRDGRLVAVEQPALERTLSLIITKADVFDKGQSDHRAGNSLESTVTPGSPGLPEQDGLRGDSGEELTRVTLVFEVMGRYSNIILVDDAGVVIEAVKHVSAEINRYRVTLPRHPYVLPPPQSKADPRALSPLALAPVLAAAGDQPAWQTLVRAYLGVSPLLAREAVFRATASTNATAANVSAQALAASLSALLSAQYTQQWSPSLARADSAILDFAPYPLTQFGAQSYPVESMCAAIHAYYEQETVASDYAGLKTEMQKALDVQRGRVVRRKESLETQQEVGTKAEDLRIKGEMLLASATQITRGQKEAFVDMLPGEPPLHIALNPLLTPVENAQDYFKRYAQARDAARSVPALLQDVALDLAYLDQLQLDLDLARIGAEVREVQRALAYMGKEAVEPTVQERNSKQRPRKEKAKLPPLTYRSDDGMEIVVGRNARQNDYVTFELASSLDLWLHARGVAGSHVIVRSGPRTVLPSTLEKAAALAAAHSAARASNSVAVDYVQRRNVHRARGGNPGLVTCLNEKTISVRPAQEK